MLKAEEVSCHFPSVFKIGAGDSSERISIVVLIRPRLKFTLPQSSEVESPSGSSSNAVNISTTSLGVGKAL